MSHVYNCLWPNESQKDPFDERQRKDEGLNQPPSKHDHTNSKKDPCCQNVRETQAWVMPPTVIHRKNHKRIRSIKDREKMKVWINHHQKLTKRIQKWSVWSKRTRNASMSHASNCHWPKESQNDSFNQRQRGDGGMSYALKWWWPSEYVHTCSIYNTRETNVTLLKE